MYTHMYLNFKVVPGSDVMVMTYDLVLVKATVLVESAINDVGVLYS